MKFVKRVIALALTTCYSISSVCFAKIEDKFEDVKHQNELNLEIDTLPVKYTEHYVGENTFFNMMTRLRNIKRWGLFFNLEDDDDERHSFGVGIKAHVLALIKNKYFGGNLNAERAAVLGMYHDVAEIVTDDIPSPIKNIMPQTQEFPLHNDTDKEITDIMLYLLPEDFREDYRKLLQFSEEDKELWKIVKYADKLDALMKCLRESYLGNKDFSEVSKVVAESIFKIEAPEVKYFVKTFMPAFGLEIPEDYNYPPIQEETQISHTNIKENMDTKTT